MSHFCGLTVLFHAFWAGTVTLVLHMVETDYRMLIFVYMLFLGLTCCLSYYFLQMIIRALCVDMFLNMIKRLMLHMFEDSDQKHYLFICWFANDDHTLYVFTVCCR